MVRPPRHPPGTSQLWVSNVFRPTRRKCTDFHTCMRSGDFRKIWRRMLGGTWTRGQRPSRVVNPFPCEGGGSAVTFPSVVQGQLHCLLSSGLGEVGRVTSRILRAVAIFLAFLRHTCSHGDPLPSQPRRRQGSAASLSSTLLPTLQSRSVSYSHPRLPAPRTEVDAVTRASFPKCACARGAPAPSHLVVTE